MCRAQNHLGWAAVPKPSHASQSPGELHEILDFQRPSPTPRQTHISTTELCKCTFKRSRRLSAARLLTTFGTMAQRDLGCLRLPRQITFPGKPLNSLSAHSVFSVAAHGNFPNLLDRAFLQRGRHREQQREGSRGRGRVGAGAQTALLSSPEKASGLYNLFQRAVTLCNLGLCSF